MSVRSMRNMMEIESQPGTYALFLRLQHAKIIPVGRMGDLSFTPGTYIYVGSAFGPGGLRSRLARHTCPYKINHWHIDYFRQHAILIEIWFSYYPKLREHEWANAFNEMPETSVPFPGFGSSDCRCIAHLFQVPAKLERRQFYDRLKNLGLVHDPIKKIEI